MAFGSEYGEKVGEENCPRCNAQAVLRSRVEAQKRIIVRLVCEKCKNVVFRGITSVEAVHLQRLRARLREALANAPNEAAAARVRRKMEELDRSEALASLFL